MVYVSCACDTANNTSVNCSQGPCRGCGPEPRFIAPKRLDLSRGAFKVTSQSTVNLISASTVQIYKY